MPARNGLERRRLDTMVLRFGTIAAAACLSGLLLAPAQAQFWSPFAPAQPFQQRQQQPAWQSYNPFGGFFGSPESRPPENRPRRSHAGNDAETTADDSHAPSPQHKKGAPPTTPIVIMGDAMSDWLAYGLEEAFADDPAIGIVRKHRSYSGLVRSKSRRDTDWAEAAREIIATEKPKIIVMMIGTNDHQPIRGTAPASPPAANPGAKPQGSPRTANSAVPETDEPAPQRAVSASAMGPFEFRTDQWEAAYIKRIDATIAALKSGGVPVIWVGLPAQRASGATSDASYLDGLYRDRAEKAGIFYVDVWDGFVDEQGRYVARGPDVEGQIRRLRSADGVYFTEAGARKLAHYAEREIGFILSRVNPTGPAARNQPALPGNASTRPLVGAVVSLTGPREERSNTLLGGAAAAKPDPADPLAMRVLHKGEALVAPIGRADDFSWPRATPNFPVSLPSEAMASATNPKWHAVRKNHPGQLKSRYAGTEAR